MAAAKAVLWQSIGADGQDGTNGLKKAAGCADVILQHNPRLLADCLMGAFLIVVLAPILPPARCERLSFSCVRKSPESLAENEAESFQ